MVGEYSYYHDFKDPLGFENNNVLYHYPVNKDKLIILLPYLVSFGTIRFQ